MAENMINIEEKDYLDAIRKAERIAAVERLINSGKYISEDEIFAVLGIDRKEREVVGKL